jgi:type IV pilus assembly protein PilA
MLATLRKRRDQDEEGFTLIELMVVVLIIAILLAIAIPTFLGARDRANDRASQSSLRNALTAAKTLFTDAQSYSSADTTTLKGIEPSLTYTASSSTSTDAKTVSIDGSKPATAPGTEFYAAAYSKSGKCFYIKDASGANGGTTFYKQNSTNGANCSAAVGFTSGTFTDNGW